MQPSSLLHLIKRDFGKNYLEVASSKLWLRGGKTSVIGIQYIIIMLKVTVGGGQGSVIIVVCLW